MELKDFFKQCQRIIEAKNSRDYKYSEMAEKIGVSSRTYGEYVRGDIDPLAARAVLFLLSEMDDNDIVGMIRKWEQSKQKKHDNLT
jgi:DNA-binding XRE family transcriptional regulator